MIYKVKGDLCHVTVGTIVANYPESTSIALLLSRIHVHNKSLQRSYC